jgi:hypothetical protein
MASTAFGAAADMYVTNAGAGGKDGTDWDNAFDETAFEADFETNMEAGDRYFIKGNMTSTGWSETVLGGSAAAPCWVIGVKSSTTAEPPTTADWAYGTDRPTVTCGANGQQWGDSYMRICNFIVTGTDEKLMRIHDNGVIFNVKVTSRAVFSATSFENAIDVFNGTTVIGCEVTCPNDIGIFLEDDCRGIGNYVHDCNDGIVLNGGSATAIANVIDTITVVGIDTLSSNFCTVYGNTIYNTATSISGTDSENGVFLNNIIDVAGTAEAAWTSDVANWWDYNCWGQAGPTRTNVTAGGNAVDSDPGLNSPATGDFTLSSSASTAINAALRMTTANLGVQVDCKYNIGVDQDDVAAAGAGGEAVIGGGIVR